MILGIACANLRAFAAGHLSRVFPFRLITAAGLACLLAAGALAQPAEGDSSRPALECVPPGAIPARGPLRRTGLEDMDISAREMRAPPDAPMRFSGDVELVYGDQRLDTDELLYDRRTGIVELPGWLRYQDAVVRLEAERAFYDTTASRGRFDRVRYFISGAEGSGHAAVVEMLDPVTARVTRFDFTTCDPDDPDWQLKAARVELDFEEKVGTARHARLEFKGVPFLYSPWLTFPLSDERKTGFLYPRLGYSSDDGLDLAAPWYWNIAPNQDATFTPRWIQDRGFWLGNEYRFLSRRQRGQFNLDYLPDDDQAGRDRYLAQADYRVSIARRWSGRLDVKRASDDNYFVDLGGGLHDSAVQFLRSSARIDGRGRSWTFSALADDFQILDEAVGPAQEPYRRLPRLELHGDWPLTAGLGVKLDSEAVYFDRDTGITGGRLDLLPRLVWRVLRPGWFFEPAFGVRYTGYTLDDAPESSITRTTPIASVDGGLIFERSTPGGRIQTLEPRMYYLYVPFRDQQDIPRFDTSELTFGFSQLFHYNRFTGPDRQADANQLTLAVTSRLIDRGDGSSVLDFSLGQIYYFRDLEVQLPNRPVEERTGSAMIGEVNWRPVSGLALHAGLQWDPEENETEVAAFGLSFRGRDTRQLALGYRFRREQVDQADIRVRYPLFRNMNVIGRLNYSFRDDELLEVLGGLEYESCCWALRLTARQFIRDRESDKRTTVFLELHLKGLGSLGRRPYPLFDTRH